MRNTILRQIVKISTGIMAMLCLCLVLAGCSDAKSPENEKKTSESTENYSSSTEEQESSSVDKVEDETEKAAEKETEKTTEKETEKGTEKETQQDDKEEEEAKITSDIMIAKVKLEDILTGKPVLYERYEADGYVFEFVVSDYDDINSYVEDAVLIVSAKDSKDCQIIKVCAEGDDGCRGSETFIYEDVNFDGKSDLLVCTGCHGNLAYSSFYCFLREGDKFVEDPSFTEICFPAIDKENKIIRGQQRSGSACHIYREYQYVDGEFKCIATLVEELTYGATDNADVWVWTVNGDEVYRASEQTGAEAYKLFYAEESRWGINSDRWDEEVGEKAVYRVTDYE